MINMNRIGKYIKEERKKAGLTQEEFAMRSGLGLRFVRELEQGKETVRLDKVNQALAMFGKEAVPGKRRNNRWSQNIEAVMYIFKITLPESLLRQKRDISFLMIRNKAYDMLPVNVIMPEDKEQMALTINGKKRNIHKKEFRKLAESYEISPKAAENMLKKICRMENKLLDQVEGAYLSKEQKEQVSQLVRERIKTLSL